MPFPAVASPRRHRDDAGSPRTALRAEIQVLRAFAVLAVVANHLAPGRLPGGYVGVDVFFVISGYLITAHLMRELDGTGRIRLAAFWARRARRLLPASLLVLLTSALATWLVMPMTLWREVMRQVLGSTLYVQNWLLAHDAEDYFASGDSPSPVTHFWSLSLEEQFYLVWPLLAFAAYVVGRRLGRPRAAVGAAFGVVVAASLVTSVVLTTTHPQAAYYVTPTRMWQLGIGGLLALVPALVATRGPRRHVVSAAGWVALVSSVWLLDAQSAVPGWVALAPVLGAAAVIWAGDAFVADVPRWGRPVLGAGLWVGAFSYSLYLWHWPLIVLVPHATGQPLDRATKLLLLAAMLVLSWLSYRYVEDPLRRLPWLARGSLRRTFAPAVVGMIAVSLVAVMVPRFVEARTDRVRDAIDLALVSGEPCFAARAMVNDCSQPHRLSLPDSPLLTTDNDEKAAPAWGKVCLQKATDPAVEECEFGVPRGKARLEVALVGDSHARHWSPALDELAVEHRWHVTMMTKGSCPPNAAALRTRRFPEYVPSCREWNRNLARRIAEDEDLDVVVTSAFTRNYVIDGLTGREERSRMAAGYRELWRQWTETGKTVVAIGDVPRMRLGDIPTCVRRAASREDPCATPASRADSADPMLVAARESDDPAVVPVSTRQLFCDEELCHSVIGGVVAYGDNNHLLGFFARSAAPYLHERMRPALG